MEALQPNRDEQVREGRKVEREHIGTIRRYLNGGDGKGGKAEEAEVIDSIVKDHLREDPAYYSKLREAQLEQIKQVEVEVS